MRLKLLKKLLTLHAIFNDDEAPQIQVNGADLDNSIFVQDAGVWIYGEALPKGILNQDESALIMRGITLAQSPAVPQSLISQLMDDAEPFINDKVY